MAKLILSNGFAMNVETHAGLAASDTVFMHGNLASNTWWQPALQVWQNKAEQNLGGRLIFAEWRGCGKSAAPSSEAELHPAILADDFILALRQLGVKKANIIGHSTGGLIALYAVLKAPDLFDRLVLLDPVSATGVQFDDTMAAAFTQMSQDREFCALVMGATIHANDASRPLFQKIVDDAFHVAKEIWHGVPAALRNIDITAELAKIQHKILILHGEFDTLLPLAGSEDLAARLPNARLHVIQGQGHSTNYENPELFVQLVDDFLAAKSEQNKRIAETRNPSHSPTEEHHV